MREQEIIRKIIDMDKAAREATHDALERRTRTAHAAEKKKKEVTDTFISMARNRVDVIRILVEANKRHPFSLVWSGRYDDNRLLYGEEDLADYKAFEISDYDIVCVV